MNIPVLISKDENYLYYTLGNCKYKIFHTADTMFWDNVKNLNNPIKERSDCLPTYRWGRVKAVKIVPKGWF